ncbi:MAG: site-specific integrase [Lachnospiraceae bacterium]|nr:site-specific integrase [Lachnospiraceae bacterium]
MAREKTNIKNVYYDDEKKLYYARLYYGVVDGKKKTEWETFVKKSEAKTRVNNFEADKIREELAIPSKVTVKQWLEQWYNDVVLYNNEITTQEGYKTIIYKHLIPKLGNMQLQKLTEKHIKKYYKEKQTEPNGYKKNGEPKPPLSSNTVRKHHTLLMTALTAAKEEHLIKSNPLESKTLKAPEYVKPEISFYDLDNLLKLFDIVYDNNIEPAIYLAGTTALRREEISGLRWDCVDFKKHDMLIRRSDVRAFNKIHTKKPKNETSTRRISMPDELYEVLERHKKMQYENKKLMGDAYNSVDIEKNYVIVDDLGYQINPATLSSSFLKLIRKYDLPSVSLRGLRHTVASVLNDNGMTLYDISKLLGHASTDITSKVYVEMFSPDNRKATQTMANAISAAKKKTK